MRKIEQLDYLINYLLEENPEVNATTKQREPQTIDEMVTLFRALSNVRAAKPVTTEFLNIQDDFLKSWNNERQITSITELTETKALPQTYLWQGDITTLAVDAIVNAANSNLLGCFQANHQCIDNIIHTRAGVQLRLACHELMTAQGRKEPAGKAKITKAFNLPADYVIHTVGPFIDEHGVTPLKEKLLANCYEACLKLADENNLNTVAFCSISTGEFNFPNERAAEIATHTVAKYMKRTHSKLQVIFNVFKDEDFMIYQKLLE